MSATGKLDRPGGSLYFEVIDATAPWAGEAELIVFRLPCSHRAACGRSLRAFLDRRAA